MRLLTTQDGLPRISWGAVIGGAILSLSIYLSMSVPGTAIGASLLVPMSHPNPGRVFGFGSGAWVIVTTVPAVFVGAYFTGRCVPVLGWRHGLLAWAVMTLLLPYGMTAIIGGAVSVAGNAATTVNVGAAAGSQAAGSLANFAVGQAQAALDGAASATASPGRGQLRCAGVFRPSDCQPDCHNQPALIPCLEWSRAGSA